MKCVAIAKLGLLLERAAQGIRMRGRTAAALPNSDAPTKAMRLLRLRISKSLPDHFQIPRRQAAKKATLPPAARPEWRRAR